MKFLSKFLRILFGVILFCGIIIILGYFCRGVHDLFMLGWSG